ncbi:hypothetical protein ACJ72_04677 [Emergomyces africanus]|uniref:Uncharacterized protein n=1 Tax=Emergomyces africanus TaxID=1955775 RepID=A0A1B7NW23_9EURO|nr:hypothetical protein ACJ72_04677 [Emergomyces africanus]
MGVPLSENLLTNRHETRKQWYRQLKDLLASLEATPHRPVLDDTVQQRLGIRTLNSSTESENVVDSEHDRYFTPDNLPISPCSPSFWEGPFTPAHKKLWPRPPCEPDLINDYYDGRHLADVISDHLTKLRWKYPTRWHQTSPGDPERPGARYVEHLGFEHPFLVPQVYDAFSKRKPHQILLMVSDHAVEEKALLRSELLAMTSFMKWKMQSMRHRQILIYPVMVISIMNLFKLRVLQGYFNGTLNIHKSEVYDFAVEDHEDAMNSVIAWLRSTSHGDTTLSLHMPIPT